MKLIFSLLILFCNIAYATTTDSVIQVANQGILIKTTKTNIWIDAVYNHVDDWENFSYKPLSDQYEKLLADNNKSNLIFATHIHRDHFHPEKVGRILDNNQQSYFIGNKQTTESMKESFYNEHRINNRIKQLKYKQWQTIDNPTNTTIQFSALKTKHSHASYNWVENTALQIKTDQLHLVHLGDIEPTDEVIKVLEKIRTRIDFLVIPYWILSKKNLIDDLETNVNISRIIISHVPVAYDQQITKMINELKSKKFTFSTDN